MAKKTRNCKKDTPAADGNAETVELVETSFAFVTIYFGSRFECTLALKRKNHCVVNLSRFFIAICFRKSLACRLRRDPNKEGEHFVVSPSQFFTVSVVCACCVAREPPCVFTLPPLCKTAVNSKGFLQQDFSWTADCLFTLKFRQVVKVV